MAPLDLSLELKQPEDRHIRISGSATSLLVRHIINHNKKNPNDRIDISPEEATMIALGIWSDTGSFSYSGTTSVDLESAAYLMSIGADHQALSKFLKVGTAALDMNNEEVKIYNQMVHSIETIEIEGKKKNGISTKKNFFNSFIDNNSP